MKRGTFEILWTGWLSTIVGKSLKWNPLPKWFDHARTQPIVIRISAGKRSRR